VLDLVYECERGKVIEAYVYFGSYRALGWKDFDEEDTVDFV